MDWHCYFYVVSINFKPFSSLQIAKSCSFGGYTMVIQQFCAVPYLPPPLPLPCRSTPESPLPYRYYTVTVTNYVLLMVQIYCVGSITCVGTCSHLSCMMMVYDDSPFKLWQLNAHTRISILSCTTAIILLKLLLVDQIIESDRLM